MSDLETDLPNLSTSRPIALLPVRIETRFSISSSELRIRVYPDEIFADLHRRPVTRDERESAETYWRDGWDPANEPAAWRALVARYGPERSAWLVTVNEPTNPEYRPDGGPVFPTTIEEGEQLFGQAVTTMLPVAWMAIAYRGGSEVHRVMGADIVSPLHLSFRDDMKEGDPHATLDELELDPELLWAVDFNEAIAKGMALTMPLTSNDLSLGFDRLLVVGVRTHQDPDESALELSALFDAHHYTRGLALVRQGTPTNNSESARSGYPPPEDADHSFAIERGPEGLEPGSDGEALQRAFGFHHGEPFARVEGTARREQVAAAAMNQALWPATLGYYLEQMARPLLTASQIDDVRKHFIDSVRGRGPLPAIRVGSVPYGILPVTSIRTWEGDSNAIDGNLAELLHLWESRYRDRLSGVPRIGRTADADADLLEVLNRDAACREVRVREVTGPGYFLNVLGMLGYNVGQLQLDRQALIDAALAEAGLTDEPRIAGMTLADDSPRIGREFVTAAPSEEIALSPNYITELRTSSVAALRAAGDPSAPEFQNPLLYHLLRHATLVEYARVGIDLAVAQNAGSPLERIERELIGIAPGTEDVTTPWSRLAAPVPGLTGGTALGTWLLDPNSTDPDRAPVRSHRDALAVLEALPTAELTRLLAETLDVVSHRLDAWLTSLATRRLSAMRGDVPSGVHVGAFAWVEDLRPRTAQAPGTAGGFIHAPSAGHAAAAAVLRNAHLTRVGAARDRAAVDLSSRRVRGALALIDGVRQGQPLGALLGYRFERSLHDAGLDRYIAPFRARFPLGRDPAAPAEQPGERVAARNVVDGLTLREALERAATASEIPWGRFGTLIPVADRNAIAASLLQLEESVDAIADLLLAESVYQAVQGNTERAAATLAALGGSGDVPEPAIAATPHRGIGFTNRVMIVLGPESASGWPASARGAAEPRLDAWVGRLLAPPASVSASVSYPAPTSEDPEHRTTITVTLAQLALGPLDVLALARASGTDGSGELYARLHGHASAQAGGSAGIEIDHARMPAMVSFLEQLEVARLLNEVIDSARPLHDRDVVVPPSAGASPIAAESTARANAAMTTFTTRRASLAAAIAAATPLADVEPLRQALWTVVALGVDGAAPASFKPDDAAARAFLLDQAAAALAELDRRIAAAATGDGLARLASLFGPHLRVLPTFNPSWRSQLDAAIAYGPSLVGDVDAPRRWFERSAQVRPHLGDLRLALLASEAISATRSNLRIAQLPHDETRPWVGSTFDPSSPPPTGALSIAMHLPTTIPGNASWAGLVLDEWPESIPAATQATAFAVHHDAPGAEAAQCILLAVPPVRDDQGTWDLPSLLAIVNETLDLAAIRAVDGEQLGLLSLLAPTTLVAANLAGDAITSDLSALSMGEDAILAPE